MSILKANRIENLTTTDGGINVNNAGKVGVNQSSPSQMLHVEDSGSNVYVRVTETGNTGIDFGQATNGNGVINLRDNADIQILTNGVEELRVLAAGGLTFNGDTAQANALGDYEEGTFTPRLVIENSGNVTIYTNPKGSYVKVGSTVTAWFNMTVDGTPSGRSTSNAIEFHDLPFTSTDDDNDGAQYYIGSVRLNGVDESHTYGDFSEAILRLNNNNTHGRIECREASTSQLRNSSLWLKDNTTIHASITYRTDS